MRKGGMHAAARWGGRFLLVSVAVLATTGASAPAAVAPLGPDALEEQASHIVSGTVLEVRSKVRRSSVERAAGVHRDRVYTITLRVETVRKGADIAVGREIEIVAWQPSLRLPVASP